jgi:hypothetical protein
VRVAASSAIPSMTGAVSSTQVKRSVGAIADHTSAPTITLSVTRNVVCAAIHSRTGYRMPSTRRRSLRHSLRGRTLWLDRELGSREHIAGSR